MNNIIYLRYISSGLLASLAFLIFSSGCAGPAKEKDVIQETDSINMPVPPEKKLSPGMAQIEAFLLEMEKSNDDFKCIIKVEKVLNYGISTKPIGKGTEIVLKITQDNVDLINLFRMGTIDQKYVLTVEQEQLVDNQIRWRAVAAKKKYTDQ